MLVIPLKVKYMLLFEMINQENEKEWLGNDNGHYLNHYCHSSCMHQQTTYFGTDVTQVTA